MEKTIVDVFKNRVNTYGDRFAMDKRYGETWVSATWNQYYDRARQAGLGLYELGVRKGDRVAILSENRLEWVYTDMGGLSIGAIVVPIYATVARDEVDYVLRNSGSKVLIVENATQLAKAKDTLSAGGELEVIAVMDTEGADLNGSTIISYQELDERGASLHDKESDLFEKLSAEVGPDDLATLQYTSGTTGMPKGAMLSHGNIMANIYALDAVEPKFGYEDDINVGFLPLSHIFERVPVHMYIMFKGITKHYAGSMETLVEDIQAKKPTILFAVPRVHEKIYQKMVMAIKEKPPLVQKLFAWAQRVGAEYSRCDEQQIPHPLGLKMRHKLAYALVFKKLQQALGGQVRWMCAAGGPIAREIVNFFNAAGIFVLEGYGMSEVCGGGTLSNLDDFSPGSVGRPLPGLDMKIAEDGEILMKGDMVFSGYWKMDELKSEIFTEDGYFKTGDIGHFDKSGRLYITDRKKDLIITAGGKNIAPQKIETLFKKNPLFAQFVVVGDKRKYLTALINLNYEVAAQMAKEKGIMFDKPEDLRTNRDFLKIIDEIVEESNNELSRVETIKKYKVLKHEFTQDSGELTASLKVKRNIVQDKFEDVIETMYEEN